VWKRGHWIGSFVYENFGGMGVRRPEYYGAEGCFLVEVEADVHFPAGRSWDLSDVQVQTADGSLHKAVAVRLSDSMLYRLATESILAAVKEDGTTIFVDVQVDDKADGPKVRFIPQGLQWPGGRCTLQMVFEIEAGTRPERLVHARTVSDEISKTPSIGGAPLASGSGPFAGSWWSRDGTDIVEFGSGEKVACYDKAGASAPKATGKWSRNGTAVAFSLGAAKHRGTLFGNKMRVQSASADGKREWQWTLFRVERPSK